MSENLIKHEGTVIESNNGVIKVEICNASACTGCHAKGACGGMDFKEKEIEVHTTEDYAVGDHVKVAITQSMGFKALFLGYIAPLILLVASVIVATVLDATEGIAALTGLSVTALYYGALYLMRNKIRSSFTFKIEQ